ncbi:iron uptake porin [Rivularia sp. UHCC 0363]|uniref:iron uptake porin n=1 Tax=Rivularia sp. UHCC 0363 TaxID=3110244 RepID=UPI002B1EA452|nr:iron uptake porin [Rivularia sp. UHCC 0363]MEA5598555.1 iron uptake porin [Rivularia sp. UHCC 0363]
MNNSKISLIICFLAAGITGFPDRAMSKEQLSVDFSIPTEETVETKLLNIPNTEQFKISQPVIPSENELSADENPMGQVNSVSQLGDVQPTDWAFQSLQSLVERYGCIAGYPNGTYRGNRALTRYEFAAGLNACLERVNELIATAASNIVTREDLATLQKLQEEFGAELATLRGRVDALEARTADIEAKRFSATTKLSGITIVGIQGRGANRADIAPRDGVKDTDDPSTNTNFINFNQLYLTSQFTPRSFLVTGLLAANGSTSPKLSNDFILGYEAPPGNKWNLSDLHYHQLLNKKLAMMVGTKGVDMIRAFRGPNRAESAANGPLSWFAQRNPILNLDFENGGIAFDWQFAKSASVQAIYSAKDIANPGKRGGLFDGNTTAGAQLLLTPAKTLDVSLYYVNNYSPNGFLSTFAGDNCFTALNCFTGTSRPLQTNAVGATVNWDISRGITLGGWGGYTKSYIPGESGDVETTNYMVYLNFPDLFGKGNLGGIYVGQPPKIVSSNLPVGNNVPELIGNSKSDGGQPGTTTHIEAFYRWRLNDNMSVTPGIIHIIEPGHTPDSDSITIGILRTSFTF